MFKTEERRKPKLEVEWLLMLKMRRLMQIITITYNYSIKAMWGTGQSRENFDTLPHH